MNPLSKKKIKVMKDGPYQVVGNIPLNQLSFVADKKGASTGYKEIQKYKVDDTYYLCRCGRSKNYPFCDGSHMSGVPFDGTETARHKTYEQMAEEIEGKQVDLLDAEELCAVARFCDTYSSTWNLVTESDAPESVEIINRQCADCPSGRLTMVTKEGKRIEPELPQEISLLEDMPAEAHGPIWVKGGIPIEDAEGNFYPIRNRVTLCRCGKSKNKPFCDAAHMQNQGELKD
ncbi:CDGSH iron-sulfur domain-containing protein [Parabacteroides sp. OttesenSCG-928-G06]|nr:CDGSH iron-sulfur domain-containing protein [Parabacteroides sp. OttesenSCG-928-G06]